MIATTAATPMIRAISISRSPGRGSLAKGQNRASCELCADGRPVQAKSASSGSSMRALLRDVRNVHHYLVGTREPNQQHRPRPPVFCREGSGVHSRAKDSGLTPREGVFDAINKGLLGLQKYRARRRQSFRMYRLACRDDLASTSANIQVVRRFQER